MRLFYLALVVTNLVSACTFTGFLPPPRDEYAWKNRNGATPAQVLSELERCGGGYQPLNVKAGESTTNAAARIQECLFAKGFYLDGGYGGICSDPSYRVEVPVCANAPIRSRHYYYGKTPSEREQRRLDQDMADAIKKYKAEEAQYVDLEFGEEGVPHFQNPEKLSNERTLQDSSDCNAYQKAIKSSVIGSLEKEKYQSVECMLAKGYPLAKDYPRDYEKYLCNRSGWREQISVCAPYAKAYEEDQKRVYDKVKTESWPYQSFEFINPDKKVMKEFRQDEQSCNKQKYPTTPDWRDLRFQSIGCMLEKGYVLNEDIRALCAALDYKSKFSICPDSER